MGFGVAQGESMVYIVANYDPPYVAGRGECLAQLIGNVVVVVLASVVGRGVYVLVSPEMIGNRLSFPYVTPPTSPPDFFFSFFFFFFSFFSFLRSPTVGT